MGSEEPGPNTSRAAAELRLQLLQEMRCQNYDLIRFSSYRTASKLRFLQKKLNLHLVDIWNVIEAFRENGLNALDPSSDLNVARLEALVSSLYSNLNKRLPSSQQVIVENHSNLLLNWLLASYSVEGIGRIRVFPIKVALATMCSGKLMDKLRYIFSQMCDPNGHLVAFKFCQYLRAVLALPASVYESPSFPYREDLAAEIFAGNGKVTVNDFLGSMMSDPGPPSLVWLPLLHRMASVENVVHATACDACHRENYTGFRYRCSKCSGFQMCQDCFWRGRVAASHTIEHEVKEYTTYKSPTKQIGHSLRKSFRCVPGGGGGGSGSGEEGGRRGFHGSIDGSSRIPKLPDRPEKPLNLSNIVPPSPLPSHNGFVDYGQMGRWDHLSAGGSLDGRSSLSRRSPGRSHMTSMRMDDEHKLIARYAARLAQEAYSSNAGRSPTDASCLDLDTSRAQRELIAQLEAKNREIMREITRLRREQESVDPRLGGRSLGPFSNGMEGDDGLLEELMLDEEDGGGEGGCPPPPLVSELRALRARKGELESHLASLQESRRHLMLQLEGLMKLLKNHQSTTPNSSPRSSKSPPPPRSAPVTPGSGAGILLQHPQGSGEMTPEDPGEMGEIPPRQMTPSRSRQPPTSVDFEGNSFSNPLAMGSSNQGLTPPGGLSTPGSRSLCDDLLQAADSVTNAMSSLVRELNSEETGRESLERDPRHPGYPRGRGREKEMDFEEDDDDVEEREEEEDEEEERGGYGRELKDLIGGDERGGLMGDEEEEAVSPLRGVVVLGPSGGLMSTRGGGGDGWWRDVGGGGGSVSPPPPPPSLLPQGGKEAGGGGGR